MITGRSSLTRHRPKAVFLVRSRGFDVAARELPIYESLVRCACGWSGHFDDLTRGADTFPGCPRCKTDASLERVEIANKHFG